MASANAGTETAVRLGYAASSAPRVSSIDLHRPLDYLCAMRLTLEIPDDLAQQLASNGKDPARLVLEAIAIESYRSGALNAYQTRCLLGLGTRYELDGFLKAHNVWDHSYSLEDLERDRQTLRQLESESRSNG